jgi:hypothetical protein
MRLGEILDQAIRLYRRNFVAFVGIIAIVYIPIMLIQTGLSYLTTAGINRNASDPLQVFTPSYLIGIMGSLVMVFVQFILIQGVATAALTRAVADNYLGQPVGILDAYKKVGSSWTRLLGVLLLLFLLLLGVGIAMLVPCAGWLTGPGAFFFLVFSVSPLVAPIVMIEKRDASTTLRRAWDLARRRFWWLLGFMFILVLFSQLVITGPTLAVNYILVLVFGRQDLSQTSIVTTIINSLVSLIGGTFYLPLQLTAYTLVYFDLRVRTEGFDLALLSMQISGAQPSLETIQELPVQLPSGKLVEWTDVGNFAILTIVGGGLYLLLVSVITFFMMGILGAAGGF